MIRMSVVDVSRGVDIVSCRTIRFKVLNGKTLTVCKDFSGLVIYATVEAARYMGHDAFAVHSNGLTSHMNWRQFKKQFSIDGNFLVVREN